MISEGSTAATAKLRLDSGSHINVSGVAHSVVGGSAWEPTPWRAVQRAAWEASLKTKVDDDFSVVLAAASLLTLSFLV
jgi:hypothetical protein